MAPLTLFLSASALATAAAVATAGGGGSGGGRSQHSITPVTSASDGNAVTMLTSPAPLMMSQRTRPGGGGGYKLSKVTADTIPSVSLQPQ